jgi:CHAT domain-containing protein
MKRINNILYRDLVIFVSISMMIIGCTTSSHNAKSIEKPKIRNLKYYKEVSVYKWKHTRIKVKEGETIILTPLYPKGFIYAVRGRIGDEDEPFDALDVDSGEIHQARASGILQIGIDKESQPIKTGILIFKHSDLDSILSDLVFIHHKKPNSRITNLTLGLLFKRKSEDLVLSGENSEALRTLDNAIQYFVYVDEKLYSTTIYRLYKLKANIYKITGDSQKFSESVNHALESLMRASRYYDQLQGRQYSFLESTTQEERYLLLTQTRFFSKISMGGDPRWGHGFANLADANGFLSRYYSEMGNLQLSLKYCEKAMDEAKKDGNRNLIARAYRALGIRYFQFGFLEQAENAFLKALDYCSAQAEWTRWGIEYSLARVHTEMNKLDSAEEILRGLRASTPTYALIRPLSLSRALALVYMKQGKYEKAIPILKRLYSTYKDMSVSGPSHLAFRTMHIYTGLALSQCYMALGQFNEGLSTLSKIESDIDNLGNPTNLKLLALLRKAKLMKKAGKDPLVSLTEAIGCLEDIRPTALSHSDYEYWEEMLPVYTYAIEAYHQKRDSYRALEIAEKARSRRFLDSLGGKKVGAKGVAAYMLSQRADGILESLSMLEDDMVEAAQKVGIKLRTVYQEDTRYSKQLESYHTTLRQAAGLDRQFGLTYNIIPISPDEIQKKLPKGMQIVPYYLSNDALYAWVINHNSIEAVKKDVSLQKIADLIKSFRNSIFTQTTKRGVTVVEKPVDSKGNEHRELYEILFHPIEEHLSGNRVIIIPYGILNYLPFQALHDGNQYLVEKYSISYSPSLSVLEILKRENRHASRKILALGNPDLNNNALDLPAAEKEVEMIKEVFPTAKILKRQKATEAAAKSLAQDHSILHFACHGEYIPKAPLASSIRLAPGNGEDGRLEAGEIFDMDINANLVVTSACQTAIGKIGKGDEVVGLTRAFIYAGAKSVLGSLWNISDEATTSLMMEFYRNLQSVHESEALRQAQLKMINSKEYNSPFFWAPFYITGGF